MRRRVRLRTSRVRRFLRMDGRRERRAVCDSLFCGYFFLLMMSIFPPLRRRRMRRRRFRNVMDPFDLTGQEPRYDKFV